MLPGLQNKIFRFFICHIRNIYFLNILSETHNDDLFSNFIFPLISEKNKKEAVPASKTSPNTSKSSPNASKVTPIKEEIKIKKEELSDDEMENGSSQKTGSCKICHLSIDLKSPKASEKLIACMVCDKKAHASCIEDTEHWTRTKWQCNDCKSCVACKGEKESNGVVS